MTTASTRSFLPRRLLAVIAFGAAGALTLAGCSALGDLANEVSSGRFGDAAELTSVKDGPSAPWLPSDATGIAARWSTRDDAATLLVVSDASLDPSRCAEIDRESAPTLAIDDAPDVYAIEHVWACGAWTVAATDDGWVGWTPNDPDEKAQSPLG